MVRASRPRVRADFITAQGVLVVTRKTPPPPPAAVGQPPYVPGNPEEGDEILLAIWDDGSVTGLNGHVDLGTGLRTALSQIVAEELDVRVGDVHMMLGCTSVSPNQGGTFASASIQTHSQPLRIAAAQARGWLVAAAAQRLGGAAEDVEVTDGVARLKTKPSSDVGVTYAQLLSGPAVVISLDPATPLKAPDQYRIVGERQPRVDLPAKLAGELVFVHDVRVKGMLHGRVIRPPYVGAEQGDFIGSTLETVDESSIAHIPGVRAVVVIRDFVGVVAEREEHAEQAMRELQVRWKAWPGMPDLSTPDKIEAAIRANPRTQRVLINEGDVDGALKDPNALHRTYRWPYQLHASIGPSCAVAYWMPDGDSGPFGLRVWAAPQNPHVLRADLALLMGIEDVAVDILRMEAAGCYGRNCADDVAGDAALLSRAVGAPVRVQLTREQENQWDSMGTAQLMEVSGTLTEEGRLGAYSFETSYPSNAPPISALLFTRAIEPKPGVFYLGDRTSRPPYQYAHLRVAVNDMAPIVRAAWFRGVAALPNVFAHESFVDELATAAGADPVEFRLRHLPDVRAAELVRTTADKAGWRVRTGPMENADGGLGPGGDVVFGQGFAYARYVHGMWPGNGAAWSAWVADVEVNRRTGEVHVRRVVTGHDAGLLVNPSGVEHQVHGNVIQATSRALLEEASFAPTRSTVSTMTTPEPGKPPLPTLLSQVNASRDFARYPIISFRDVPVVEVHHIMRPGDAPLGAGESASVPGAAAIANAIFDATGVRFRSPPFTPEKILDGLNGPASAAALPPMGPPSPPVDDASDGLAAGGARQATTGPFRFGRGWWAGLGALLVGGIGAIAGLAGWRGEIAPVSTSGARAYSEATIERGRVLASAGNCVGCHTMPGLVPFAGGRPMDTPFGRVYTTNLTPDRGTGLGSWSFSAFQRAMREGISRDGRHLYPAFPYTAFAKTSDDDLLAIYAYLQSLTPVYAPTPQAEMKAPFGVRSLIAGWNGLYHEATSYKPDPNRSVEWNRGAYLVNGLGHCGSCHTPRNALGAERNGDPLAGAMVKGWEAHALNGQSKSAVPWSKDEFYLYLRQGHTQYHGVAAGPMAGVVSELAALPDEDISAMATYLGSLSTRSEARSDAEIAAQATQRAAQAQDSLHGRTQRMFQAACASCHHDGDGPTLLGVNAPLALNSNLTSAKPDNLLRTLLEGVRETPHRDVGFMPSFAQTFDDAELADLARYLRARYAQQEPPWTDLENNVARIRRDVEIDQKTFNPSSAIKGEK
ncbi:molybdopterin-dependent oxidoreductase [Variovorax sp. J22R187]|uniref:molybdopterin cofactor-binding domain-containing protein n=1 Tax=Variovorax saccharolyticus TaxID=3053516 RepID=UPI0025758EA0|nr:molybdopterin cofactor-binding domain-containing protein [Variovorax sp. J22R187]MDM0021862.1 molybdopterin-dependent oxidoreductase [Variovorax sp. J22R187]